MVRVAPGVRISPSTTGFASGASTKRAATPRFSRILTIDSALRRTLAVSVETLGIASRPMNSSTIWRSCALRQSRAALAAGLLCAHAIAAANAPSQNFILSPDSCLLCSYSHFPPILKRFRDRDFVGKLEVAANRNAHCDARHLQPERLYESRKICRRGLAFHRWIGRQNNFLCLAAADAIQQSFDLELLRPDATQRRDRAIEHVIQTLESARGLDRQNVVRLFDHANLRPVADLRDRR